MRKTSSKPSSSKSKTITSKRPSRSASLSKPAARRSSSKKVVKPSIFAVALQEAKKLAMRGRRILDQAKMAKARV